MVSCGKSHGVDTGRLKSTFKTAEPALRTEADTAVAAIRAGKLPEAIADLRKLRNRAKLTAEQQQAIKETIAEIQRQMELDAAKPKK